jgi:DNA-binding response OmpR family regulator
MNTPFDAAEFVARLEVLGAELRAHRMQDGTGRVFRLIGWKADKTRIEALWKEQIEPHPERETAIADVLLKRRK